MINSLSRVVDERVKSREHGQGFASWGHEHNQRVANVLLTCCMAKDVLHEDTDTDAGRWEESGKRDNQAQGDVNVLLTCC